jgi:hypothetical protein
MSLVVMAISGQVSNFGLVGKGLVKGGRITDLGRRDMKWCGKQELRIKEGMKNWPLDEESAFSSALLRGSLQERPRGVGGRLLGMTVQ